MKWIGQHIYDFISKFRNDVYLEGLSTTTNTNVLVVDSDGKISKSTTLADDIIESEIDTLAGLTSFGSAGATTDIAAGDLTMFNPVNDGNPTISVGKDANDRFSIETVYNSSAQTIDYVNFQTYTTSSGTNDGRYTFLVDEVELVKILDGGLFAFGNLQSKDADATVAVIDTTASSATQGGKIRLVSDDDAVMGDNHRLGVIQFEGAEDAGSGAGSNTHSIGARIQAICRDAWDGSNNDADLEFYTTDGTTESKVLTLDADKLATFTGAVTVTGALTGTLATASQPNITGVGTIGTGVWQGTAIASAYLDSDTAHLTTDQTFTGKKTFSDDVTFNCDTVTFESANADDPIVTIKNTSNATNDMASLKFVKDRGATPGVGDNLAEIYFIGEDADQNSQEYGRILCETDVVTGGQESGVIKMGVANHDGGNGYGLILTGGSANDEVDVTVGLGASSVTTVAGSLRPKGQIVLMRAAFKDDVGTDKHYIPLQSELEQTQYFHEMNSFVAPYPGKLLKVMYRASGNLSGGDVTFTLEQIDRNETFLTTPDVLETITVTGPTNNTTDPNMVTANFVGGSGTNAFVAGDQIMLGMQFDTDVTGSSSRHFFTLVFEFDFSGLA